MTFKTPNIKKSNRSKKSFLTLGSALVIAGSALLPMSQAMAETQFKLRSVSDTTVVTEGYVRTVEQWIAGVEMHRSAGNTKHSDHRDPDVWIANVGTLLSGDHDGDGYFSGFNLSIDADVEWGHSDIYLSIYLQEHGTDNQLFHTSSTYTIYGDSESDEYGIEVELLDNYPANIYDIQIDVHDAYSYEVLDSVSSEHMQNLGALPLESEHRHPPQPDETVVEHVGSGGPALLALCAMVLMTRRRSAGRSEELPAKRSA